MDTDTSSLTAPTPTAPTDTTVDAAAASFSWTLVPEATAYWLQVASSPDFEELHFDGAVGESTTLTLADVLPPDASTLYWRVRAGREDAWGPFSEPRSFSVTAGPERTEQPASDDAPTDVPEPITPQAGAPVDGPAATFSWTGIAEASAYRLEIATSPAFDDVVCAIDTGASTHLTVYEMLPEDGSMFYWRVRGRSADGWLPWTAPQPFEASTDQHVETYETARETSRAKAEARATQEEEEQQALLPPFLLGDTPRWRTALVMGVMVVSFVALIVLLADIALDLGASPTETAPTVDASTSPPPTQYDVLDAATGTYQIPIDRAIERLVEQEAASSAEWEAPE